MMPLLDELSTDECPFADLPEKRRTLYSLTREEMQHCCWVKPLLVAQINFQEWTHDGHLRHASFAGLRNDKDPQQSCANKSLSQLHPCSPQVQLRKTRRRRLPF